MDKVLTQDIPLLLQKVSDRQYVMLTSYLSRQATANSRGNIPYSPLQRFQRNEYQPIKQQYQSFQPDTNGYSSRN